MGQQFVEVMNHYWIIPNHFSRGTRGRSKVWTHLKK